jgi:hypothetical protein
LISPPTRIFAERVNFGRHVYIHMQTEPKPDKYFVAKPVQFEGEPEDVEARPPMLQLHPPQAQLLIDALWDVGFRPTQGKQSEGQVAATEHHLNDMRAIVFAKLQVPKP